MNKKALCIISLFSPLCLVASTGAAPAKPASSGCKIGYVSSIEIVTNSKLGKDVKNKLDEKFKASSKDIQSEEQKITKIMQEYKAKESTLSDSARESEQTKLMKLRRDFEAMVQEKDEEIKRFQQKLNDQLTKEAVEAAAELAQAEGLEVVNDIDTGKSLYVASHVNYTAKFTEKINKRYDAEEAKKKSSTPAKTEKK